jgi:hypothetical protein
MHFRKGKISIPFLAFLEDGQIVRHFGSIRRLKSGWHLQKNQRVQGLPHQGTAFRPEIRGLPAF